MTVAVLRRFQDRAGKPSSVMSTLTVASAYQLADFVANETEP
ncbi:hypothetical protein ACIQU6_32815 [Streptomyces sp. NPDC090442]